MNKIENCYINRVNKQRNAISMCSSATEVKVCKSNSR